MCRKIGAVKYLECSAKTGEGVHDLFQWTAKLSTKDPGVLRRLFRIAAKDPTH